MSQTAYSLNRIAAGDHDGYLRTWADALRAWGHPVTVRFGHEVNGWWYPWAEGVNGNAAGSYVGRVAARARRVHGSRSEQRVVDVEPERPDWGSVPLAGFRIDIARARALGARPDGLDPGQDLIDGHLKKTHRLDTVCAVRVSDRSDRAVNRTSLRASARS